MVWVFFQGNWHPPVGKKFCEKEKNVALVAGLFMEMLIAVCCSRVTAQITCRLIDSVTLTPHNNVSFIFSTIQTVIQNVSTKIVSLVISSLNCLTLNAMRIIIRIIAPELSEEKMEEKIRTQLETKPLSIVKKKEIFKKLVVFILWYRLQYRKHKDSK